MLILEDGALAYSATDMADAAACEFAVLRSLDARLGRVEPVLRTVDATRQRAGVLGAQHERRVLEGHLRQHGPFDPATGQGVLVLARPRDTTRESLRAAHDATLQAVGAGADVVFQAGFFDGRFTGWADFLVREGRHTGRRPRYAVVDTKLARQERPTALLQVTAYADQLLAAGVDVADDVHLVLGDHVTTSHRLRDLLPVYRERRRRLQDLLDRHQDAGAAVRWGDDRFRACGRCEVCVPELEQRRDVLLVAGVRTHQRTRLLAAGVRTVEDLAARTEPVAGIGATTLTGLRRQAELQAKQDAAGGGVEFDLFDTAAVAALPAPDPGDVFFDFEGDPLWAAGELGPDGRPAVWGLEYLFGLVEAPQGDAEPTFRAFWAHDRAAEKQALVDFLDYVQQRRAAHPGMHVYHYAPYEKSALLRLAGRHGVGEDVVDELLSAGVLVDLYATVRASLRTGQRSYSLKKLEPLYLPAARTGEVTTAGDSIAEYAEACARRAAGDEAGWTAAIDAIAAYNADDCRSTLRLRDWLLAQAAERGVRPGRAAPAPAPDGSDGAAPEHDDLAARLRAHADDPAGHVDGRRSDDQQAVALLAAALGYHWREDKPFWWAHFDRLVADPAEWTDARSTFVADRVEVVEDWHVPAGRRTQRRVLRMTGRLEPGSELRAGAPALGLFDRPVPEHARTSSAGSRGWAPGFTVEEVTSAGDGSGARDQLLVTEQLKAGDAPHDRAPMGLGPTPPPSTALVAAALRGFAEQVAGHLPVLPAQAALDLVRRRPPRTRSGAPLPRPGSEEGDGVVAAITAAVRDLDGSYLAVQGPPGTGKTYTGSHVIADLVASGWRVGVVAQSHAVVENLLVKVVEAGVDAAAVAKKPRGSRADPAAPWVQPRDTTAFGAFYAARDGGLVVGGTMWDFTNPARLPEGGFDLLVVDEAGQFCLANTLAVSAAARNLLLLGDPQQLPQVSQGHHPEPVDASALGWLTDGHDTLPAELGYFLATTWRMHPALCAPVSGLSYDGRLTSVEHAARRTLEGVEPGVRCVLVDHVGNAVSSVEEAAEVVAQVRAVLGRRWVDPAAGEDRPLEAADVLVVAAYNAQVWTIARALERAGLSGVRVGTVDKFQGQEAPVVLVSTAASSPEDVPRGMEFLLNRNRLNVALSRGEYAAVVVRARELTDHLPATPAQLVELGAFIGLCAGS
ncbi:TM0106 family RecB-like putative nuclease [Cellulomonas sp. Marseille-Q8402]